jgi:hypothetical protein
MAKKILPGTTTHGGEAAIKRLHDGKEYSGLALQEQARVIDDYEVNGRAAMVTQNAIRLQTAANLFWDAVSKAAQDQDLDALDKYIARYGWLAGCSLRAWEQVRKEDTTTDTGINALDVLAASKGSNHEQD